MDYQILTICGTVCGYMTALVFFLHKDTKNTIKEWREEHIHQMDLARKQMDLAREETKHALENNEKHWREMFMHFNARVDGMKKG